MVLPFDTVTKKPEETRELGRQMGVLLKQGRGQAPVVVCCRGELGSGKTTFVQGVAAGLGISGRLLSPTFIIVRRHHIPHGKGHLFHLDLYRLDRSKETESFGLADLLAEPDSVIIIEWPERLDPHTPKDRIDVHFSVLPNGDHAIDAKLIGNPQVSITGR